ncbi:MAG TPA: endonuclease III [Bdellovibrionota bacterium]|nr:endonuclease III [Bdellovibrionota bacterium]
MRLIKEMYPDVECALTHENPLQLLVSTILSAQCTDERVNKVTPELFRRFKTARDFASVPREELEDLIRSTGFFRSKAKSIQGTSEKIADDYGGRVPDTMDELVRLPGVGRKTANVVLGTAFGKNDGVVVDTHVGRIARRLGLTKHNDPEKVEQDLMRFVPREEWTMFSHRLIWHGRRLCKAIRPKCPECKLASLCPSAEL